MRLQPVEVVRPSEKRGTNMWTSPAESRDRAKRRPREDLPITGSLLKISVAAALVLSLQIMAVAAGRQRNALSSSSSSTPLKPSFGQTSLSNHTVRVGDRVQFSCVVNHLGKYKVAWLHSEKDLLAVHPIVITQNDRLSVSYDSRSTYHLKLHSVQESDAGMYICQINTGPVISISGTLSVVVPPDIVDDKSSSDTLANEGMRVILECQARGNPKPIISWKREDEKPIKLCKPNSEDKIGKRRKCKEVMVHNGAELELPQVSRFDSGVYYCMATNGVPPTVSKSVRLYVDFPPTIWITHQRVGGEIGGSAVLECLTAAHPPSLNYWMKDGKSVYITPSENKYEFHENGGKPSFYNILMRLRIHNLTKVDFGTYRCLAKNSQGTSDGEISLYEKPRPSTTTHAYSPEDIDWSRKEFTPVDQSSTSENKKDAHVFFLNEMEDIVLAGEFNDYDVSSDRSRHKGRGRQRKKNMRKKNRKDKTLDDFMDGSFKSSHDSSSQLSSSRLPVLLWSLAWASRRC